MFHVEHYACEYRKYVVSLHLRIAIFFFIVEWWRVVGSVTAFFFKKKETMLQITRNEERIMREAAEYGTFRMGDLQALRRLMELCGVGVRNTTCSSCYKDAAIECFHYLRKEGYAVQD